MLSFKCAKELLVVKGEDRRESIDTSSIDSCYISFANRIKNNNKTALCHFAGQRRVFCCKI